MALIYYNKELKYTNRTIFRNLPPPQIDCNYINIDNFDGINGSCIYELPKETSSTFYSSKQFAKINTGNQNRDEVICNLEVKIDVNVVAKYCVKLVWTGNSYTLQTTSENSDIGPKISVTLTNGRYVSDIINVFTKTCDETWLGILTEVDTIFSNETWENVDNLPSKQVVEQIGKSYVQQYYKTYSKDLRYVSEYTIDRIIEVAQDTFTSMSVTGRDEIPHIRSINLEVLNEEATSPTYIKDGDDGYYVVSTEKISSRKYLLHLIYDVFSNPLKFNVFDQQIHIERATNLPLKGNVFYEFHDNIYKHEQEFNVNYQSNIEPVNATHAYIFYSCGRKDGESEDTDIDCAITNGYIPKPVFTIRENTYKQHVAVRCTQDYSKIRVKAYNGTYPSGVFRNYLLTRNNKTSEWTCQFIGNGGEGNDLEVNASFQYFTNDETPLTPNIDYFNPIINALFFRDDNREDTDNLLNNPDNTEIGVENIGFAKYEGIERFTDKSFAYTVDTKCLIAMPGYYYYKYESVTPLSLRQNGISFKTTLLSYKPEMTFKLSAKEPILENGYRCVCVEIKEGIEKHLCLLNVSQYQEIKGNVLSVVYSTTPTNYGITTDSRASFDGVETTTYKISSVISYNSISLNLLNRPHIKSIKLSDPHLRNVINIPKYLQNNLVIILEIQQTISPLGVEIFVTSQLKGCLGSIITGTVIEQISTETYNRLANNFTLFNSYNNNTMKANLDYEYTIEELKYRKYYDKYNAINLQSQINKSYLSATGLGFLPGASTAAILNPNKQYLEAAAKDNTYQKDIADFNKNLIMSNHNAEIKTITAKPISGTTFSLKTYGNISLLYFIIEEPEKTPINVERLMYLITHTGYNVDCYRAIPFSFIGYIKGSLLIDKYLTQQQFKEINNRLSQGVYIK